MNRSKDAEKFENMITMKDGRVVEAGKVASLLSKAENEVEA